MAVTLPEPADCAELRQKEKDEKLCKEIINVLLRRDGPRRVLLAGKAGIGKTRLAKMVGKHAGIYISHEEDKTGEKDTNKGYCFLTLFLHLNKMFDDEWSLYENIASQLSVYSDFEETEVDDRDEDEEDERKAKDLDELKKNIIKEVEKREVAAANKEKEAAAQKAKGVASGSTKKLPEKKDEKAEKIAEEKAKKDRHLLLILDDVGAMTKEDVVMKELKLEKFLVDEILNDPTRLKIIITIREEDEEPPTTETGGATEDTKGDEEDDEEDKIVEEGTETPATVKAEVPKGDGEELQAAAKPDDMSQTLLDTISELSLRDLFLNIVTDEWKIDEELISEMVKKSKNSPAAIVVLANSLKQITRSSDNPGKENVEKLIKEVLSADRSDQGSSSQRDINPIMCLAYELLGTGFKLKDAILDCFWHSLDFFKYCGCVYYRDLITQWIIEGYFDPVRSVEKAYENGHLILMELINRGMLKIQENNVVVPERAMRNLIDPRRRGLFGRSRLRFSRVYRGDKAKGIGKITQIDDMIKTVQAKRGDHISTILVSGDRLRRENPAKYFKKLDHLEVLALFEPTVEPFVPALEELKKQKNTNQEDSVELRVLVIRDCDLLSKIEALTMFGQLQVLEVSGASSLKSIPHDFFSGMPELRSLHLSGLQITSSPSSISELKKLHCLIIRDCPLLEDLPNIQELVELEVVDISGARGLQTCFDNRKGDKKDKSKNKNFYHLKNLQLLDFSESQIERLPIFQDSANPEKLHALTRLLLRNCSKLRRLPSLKPLSGLQILDLSGTTSLVEMLEVCFEDKKELKTLNLTGTNLNELATTIEELSSLNKLLLKDCTNLELLPNIQKLTNLEVIDVSGCTKLHTIEGSFEDMFYLREVNLSGTKVMFTPELLPKESRIRCLKRITLSDESYFEGEEWRDVKEAMQKERADKASSSEAVVKSQEIAEKESEETGEEIQTNDSAEERLLQVPIDRDIYKKILLSFDSGSPQEAMEIIESNGLGEEALANAESVSLVDISSTRLTSIFNKTNSVKGCLIRMSKDLGILFADVEEERLGSMESLLITNLPSLESISRGGSFKNLKYLSIDCCPNIVTIFPEASQLPSSLEVMHVKYCEKLVKVFKEEGQVSTTLTTLCLVGLPELSAVGAKLPNMVTLKVKNCPKLVKVFEGEGEVSTLTTLCLHDLPELSCVGAKLPNLETLDKRNCPKLLAEKEELRSSVS